MQTGMLKDATLQELLRGNARMGVDGDCGRMEAVIAQTWQTGLSFEDYRTMFPEVNVEVDHLLLPPKPLKGKLRQLADIVAKRLEDGQEELPYPSLYKELGMQQQNFSALVKKPEWRAYITRIGLIPQRLKGRVIVLRKTAKLARGTGIT
jgi:hypothetical protein